MTDFTSVLKETDHVRALLRVIALIDSGCDQIVPLLDESGDLHVFVTCNDLFYWASADLEELGPSDVGLLVRCATDLEEADPEYGTCHVFELYCCRKRHMRPQYPFFRRYDSDVNETDTLSPPVRALFDALGLDGSDRARG